MLPCQSVTSKHTTTKAALIPSIPFSHSPTSSKSLDSMAPLSNENDYCD